MFLALCAPPDVRRDCEMELMMRYLMARGQYGRSARENFREDVRAGLLVCFVFFLLNHLFALQGGSTASASTIRGIEWFSVAIDDWNCDTCVGGSTSPKAAKPKRKYIK